MAICMPGLGCSNSALIQVLAATPTFMNPLSHDVSSSPLDVGFVQMCSNLNELWLIGQIQTTSQQAIVVEFGLAGGELMCSGLLALPGNYEHPLPKPALYGLSCFYSAR